jgi:hypothetical protein
MKKLIFDDYPFTVRKDIVTFSPTFISMAEQIKELSKKGTIELYLGRINDSGINITTGLIKFFKITQLDENKLRVHYLSDIEEADKQKATLEKTIRFDNLFGEIPVLPGYDQMLKFFSIGEELEAYRNFIYDARELLREKIGEPIQLCYKNDFDEDDNDKKNNSFSVIEGIVKEVNKGNIFMHDYKEILVINNATVTPENVSRNKNHRFISEKGYLCSIFPPRFFSDESGFDDGKSFGQEATWKFSAHIERVVV